MANERTSFLTFVDPDVSATDNRPSVGDATAVTSVMSTASDDAAPAPLVSMVPIEPEAPKPVTRTYHQDMTTVMGTNDPRTMSKILADARHEEAVQEAKTLVSPKNKAYLFLSIFAILAGVAILGYVLYRNYTTDQTLQAGERSSLMSAETNTNVTLGDNETFQNRNRVREAFRIVIPSQTIHNIFFTRQTFGGLQQLSFDQMIAATGGTIPAELLPTLDSTHFMYGTYQLSRSLPFLILRVNDYDDAFAGMRAWEPLMVNQLGFLFDLPDALLANLNRATFTDEIIANQSVRVARYQTGVMLPERTQPAAIEDIDIGSPFVSGTSTSSMLPKATGTNQSQALDDNAVSVQTTATNDDTVASGSLSQSDNLILNTTPEIAPTEQTQQSQPTVENPYREGDVILFYTFLSERTVLIATSPSVLQEILFRLTNAQLLL